MEKICVVRGDTYMARSVMGWLRFNWDAEAKTWYRMIPVDENGVGDFSYSNHGRIKEKFFTAAELEQKLRDSVYREIKISVSFE